MLILNPEVVRFGSVVWEDVASVAIDEAGERVVVEWGDGGSQAVFVDVPQRRVTARVTRRLAEGEVEPVRVGDSEDLVFHTTSGGSDVGRMRVTIACVVVRVRHEVGRGGGGTQVIDLVGVGPDGATDPVVREAWEVA